MGCDIIPATGLIRVEVTVENTKDKTKTKTKKLLADTGTVYTVIDVENANNLSATPQPIEGHKGDDTFMFTDLTMTVEVEDAAGNKKIVPCDKMRVKLPNKAQAKQWKRDGIEGIMGMDQFDTFAAYPKKNAAKTRAFLRLRPADPPKKKWY